MKFGDSLECYCYLRNVQDLLLDGKTSHDWRLGEPVSGAIISFGSIVEYHPICAKYQSFGEKVLPGIFVGYALYAGQKSGKEMFWSETLRGGKFWTRKNLMLGDSTQRRF